MFFRDIKRKRNAIHDIQLAEVHLPIKLGHRDAERLYMEPLNAQLTAANLGTVLECKQRTRGEGVVIGIDLFLGLTDISKTAFRQIVDMLEHLTAPFGSSIRLTDAPGNPHLFGNAEGIELSLAQDIVPDAHARRDLAGLCREVVEDLGVNRGWVESNGLTRLYFYGEDYQLMKSELAKILSRHPKYADANLRRLA